jgi:glycosyltransferase involved in cell wall biosynthesis
MGDMIRIGFDARWYTTSGVGMYVANLLECMGELEDDDFEIVAYEFADNPVPVVSKRIRKQIVKGGKYSLAGQLELARRCRIDRLDLFHAPFYIVPIAAPCPVVCTIHDLIAFLFPIYNPVHQSIVKLGYRVAVRKASRIITVSETTKRDLELILSVPLRKITRIYNAYSQSTYHEIAEPGERVYLRQRYGIEGEYVLTLSAGNWRTKNLTTALQAMIVAAQRSDVRFRPVIVGPEEGFRASGMSGSLQNALVTGYVPKEDLPRFYRNAAAFLSVSLYEGFGIPLAEAMGCGCPCIISNGGSLPEIAGNAAPVFDCRDAEGMADAIVRVLQDAAYREELSRRGLRRSAEFSYEVLARETLRLYREIAGSEV